MIRTFKTIDEVRAYVAELRKNIGNLRPVTDTSFTEQGICFVKYLPMRETHDVTSYPYKKLYEVDDEPCYEMGEAPKTPESGEGWWYTCGEYEFCKTETVIGWASKEDLRNILG